MAESLRQKIKGLREPERAEKDGDYVWLGARDYNECLDDVIEIYDEAMAEKESPDEEGIWWHINKDGYMSIKEVKPMSKCVVQLKGDKTRLVSLDDDGFTKLVKQIGGKWIKAILPEPKG